MKVEFLPFSEVIPYPLVISFPYKKIFLGKKVGSSDLLLTLLFVAVVVIQISSSLPT
jgi:hypothetical protein